MRCSVIVVFLFFMPPSGFHQWVCTLPLHITSPFFRDSSVYVQL
ncbi:hypothetical protein NC652_020657 [Populus alba x Populus x berolinensis]|nr:hypothetical protein NC652_020657 [Populus alba x Populus x berolinensis]